MLAQPQLRCNSGLQFPKRRLQPPTPISQLLRMLFFFELGLFALAMLTLALGEFVSRGLALGLWLACTVLSLLGYLLASRSALTEDQQSRLDERWARTLLYTWRRTNALLVVGAVAVAGWYWFASS